MKNLDAAEKQLLSQYMTSNSKRRLLRSFTPVARGLIGKGILFIPDGFDFPDISGRAMSGYAQFNMHEWAWRYLKQHPKTLRV